MTFDGRQPSIGCTVYYLKKKTFTTPHLDSHSTTDPIPDILSACGVSKKGEGWDENGRLQISKITELPEGLLVYIVPKN